MTMRVRALCGLLLAGALTLAAADAPDAAMLNLQVKLDSGVIRLSDLWRNAGPKAATVIGTAPPPGSGFTIEASQLAYIAQLYNVDWKPASGAERATVERAGRPLERDEVLDPIRRNLFASGVAASMTVELAAFTPLMVPPLAFPTVMVEGMAYDAGGERFNATLLVSSEGMDRQSLRVSGRVIQMGSAVVAVRRLQAEDVLTAADVKLMQLPERRLPAEVLRTLGQVMGQAAKRTVTAGQPLVAADVGQPMMIAKGAQVVMVMDTPGLSISAQGLAMSSGGRDDTIEVMNPLSRAVVAARVVAPGRAVIMPGSTPLVPAAERRRQAPEVAQ